MSVKAPPGPAGSPKDVRPYLEINEDKILMPDKELRNYSLRDLEDAYEQAGDMADREKELASDLKDDVARLKAQETAMMLGMKGVRGFDVDIIADPEAIGREKVDFSTMIPLDPLQGDETVEAADRLGERIMRLQDPLHFLRAFVEGGELPESLDALERTCRSWHLNARKSTEEEWHTEMLRWTQRYMYDLHKTPSRVTHVFYVLDELFFYLVLGKDPRTPKLLAYQAHYYLHSESATMEHIQAKKD